MHIRMMGTGTQIVTLLAAGIAAAGGLLGPGSDVPAAAPPAALVIDAATARDGRDLVDDRLDGVDAEVRLPRTAAEARTNVRYFAEQGHRVVVAGPVAGAAAGATGVSAVHVPGVAGALKAAR